MAPKAEEAKEGRQYDFRPTVGEISTAARLCTVRIGNMPFKKPYALLVLRMEWCRQTNE
jgi:hypothetical protein